MSNFSPGAHEPSAAHQIILKRIRDIPSLPDVVNRLLEIIGNPNAPASELARLISYDPGLSTKILRMVNSAAYGFQRQISSIQHGIMILGFNTVRGLVLSASIFKMFEGKANAQGLNHQAFWEHSLGTATASRILARELRIPESDDIFTAGMLHDIGKVVLDVYFTLDYRTVLEHARKHGMPVHGQPFYALETEVLGVSHSDIGNFLAAKWKLPVTISEVIQHHHDPFAAENCQKLVCAVALANELAIVQYERMGLYDPQHFSPELVEYFDLTDDDLRHFLHMLKESMGSAQELLHSIQSR